MRRIASAALLAFLSAHSFAQGTPADFERAARYSERFRGVGFHAMAAPHWIENGRWLWYTVDDGPGKTATMLVDTASGRREAAFDPARLADALHVPVADLRVAVLGVQGNALILSQGGKRWRLDRRTYAATEEQGKAGPGQLGSLPAFLPPHPSGGGGESFLTIENRSSQPVDVYWINTDGQRVKYGSLQPGESRVQHTFAEHVWLLTAAGGKPLAAYEATEGACSAVFDGTSPTAPPRPRPASLSPDGKWDAVIRDSNVWLTPQAGGDAVPLSTDGKPSDAYEWAFAWSPDGRYLATLRTEPAQEHKVYEVQSSPPDQVQPKLVTLDYLKPGDKIAHPRLVVFDTVAKKEVTADDALAPNPWAIDELHWSADSKEVYYLYNQRGHQVLRLLAADPAGHVRTVIEEKSPTFIDYAAKTYLRYLDKTGEAIWMSETRTGYNHLYLVDLKSGRVAPITSGPWMVRSVENADDAKRQLLLRVMGIDPKQDPYHFHYIRVNYDGSGFTRLTDGDGNHRLVWSPDGKTYVDIYSRVDMAPVSELRRASDGRRVALLETGSDAALKAAGWQEPERFVAKARDGKTDIWGVIYRPTNFDPSRKYPVIEDVYAGPQDFFTPKSFSPVSSQAQLAENGFVVVKLDGMGTNWRSKAFHDVCWKNLADAGFPDRILWMKAAGATRPWMDLSKVGIVGTSAGGQNAADAVFRFGDFYKAAVSDCGCQDNRMDKIWWNELWMGWPVGPEYAASSNVTAAKNLKGKLYLMVGEMDNNVDPASTMQVVNALIQSGKDFDLLVAPNTGHGVLGLPYAHRRMVDFFVRNLWGIDPKHTD